jgi:hypothetical protein
MRSGVLKPMRPPLIDGSGTSVQSVTETLPHCGRSQLVAGAKALTVPESPSP